MQPPATAITVLAEIERIKLAKARVHEDASSHPWKLLAMSGFSVPLGTAIVKTLDSRSGPQDPETNLRAVHFIEQRSRIIAKKKAPHCCGAFRVALATMAQAGCTWSACRPFGPWTTLKVTFWPSCRDLKPVPTIARKCTNTSSPFSRLMKPKPLASLNHFTVPV